MSRPKILKIQVKDQSEADAITTALSDPGTRAFVVIVGTLLPFGKTDRTRILSFVNDKLDESAGRLSVETHGDRHSVDVLKAI